MKAMLISSFAKMIQEHQLCTIDDVPEEYREAVIEYMNNDKEPVSRIIDTATTKIDTTYGAIFLPSKEVEADVTDTGCICNVSTEDIFAGVVETEFMPVGIQYNIGLVENTFGKFNTDPNVEITNTDTGFEIQINGAMNNTVLGSRIIRIDIKINSTNYEEMIQTLYLIAK